MSYQIFPNSETKLHSIDFCHTVFESSGVLNSLLSYIQACMSDLEKITYEMEDHTSDWVPLSKETRAQMKT